MDDFARLAQQEIEIKRIRRRQGFWIHVVVWALTGVLLFVIWLLATPDSMPWFIIPILAWAIILGAHAAWVFLLRSPQEIIMAQQPAQGSALATEPFAAQPAPRPATEPLAAQPHGLEPLSQPSEPDPQPLQQPSGAVVDQEVPQ
jgi:hypothetical protein